MSNAHTNTNPTRYVRDIDLAERYDVYRQSVWRWAKQARFPQPYRLTPGCVRWRLDEVEAWEAVQQEKNKSYS